MKSEKEDKKFLRKATSSIDKLNADITRIFDNVMMLNKQNDYMIEVDPSIKKIFKNYNCEMDNFKVSKILDLLKTVTRNLDIFLGILNYEDSNTKNGKVDIVWNGKIVGFVTQYQECLDVVLDEIYYIKHKLDNINHIYIAKKKNIKFIN